MGSGLILPGTLLQMLLLVPSMVRGTEGKVEPPPAPALFLYQTTSECHFANGTAGEIWFLDRYIWDRQEYLRFDSRTGRFQAISELCKGDDDYFNGDTQWMEYMRGQVENYCRHNYRVDTEGHILTWTAEPIVKISHSKADRLAHHSILICTVAGYYPSEINIKWLKNGQEQTEGLGYSEKFQNGDWTFQDQVMLEMVPARGDVYACQVEHSSLKEPITVQWEPRSSTSAKSKVWTGALGALLGVVLGTAGVSFYLKSRRGVPTAPATGLIG